MTIAFYLLSFFLSSGTSGGLPYSVPCPSSVHRVPHQQTVRLAHSPATRRPAARRLRCVACLESDGASLRPSVAGIILWTARPGRLECLPHPESATPAAGISFAEPADRVFTRRHPGGSVASLVTWTASDIALPSIFGLGSRYGSGGTSGAGGSACDGLQKSPRRQRRAARRRRRVRVTVSAALLLRGIADPRILSWWTETDLRTGSLHQSDAALRLTWCS